LLLITEWLTRKTQRQHVFHLSQHYSPAKNNIKKPWILEYSEYYAVIQKMYSYGTLKPASSSNNNQTTKEDK